MYNGYLYDWMIEKIGTVIGTFTTDERSRHTVDNLKHTDIPTTQLFEDIKYRQDKINESLINYESAILAYSFVKGILLLKKVSYSVSEAFPRGYSPVDNSKIQSGEIFTEELAANVANNDTDFRNRINRIQDVLDLIRWSVIGDTTKYPERIMIKGGYLLSTVKMTGTAQLSDNYKVNGTETLFNEEISTSEFIYISVISQRAFLVESIESNVLLNVNPDAYISGSILSDIYRCKIINVTLTEKEKSMLGSINKKSLTLKDIWFITG